ncbi:hypothetical protein MMC29_000479 [Sticta canariensis]|nr:hypothetical protein [Sticta canariensis]
MRIYFLPLLLLFVCSPFSFGFTNDVYYIETLNADFYIFLDTAKYEKWDSILTKNVTLGFPGFDKIPTSIGVESVIASAYTVFPSAYIAQTAITTQRITPVGPTDENYAFTEAEAITYLTFTYFGTGNLTGQSATVYSRVDDTFVKTNLPIYGGWRTSVRAIRFFGFTGNLAVLPADLRP